MSNYHIQEIQKQFNEIISHSQDIDNPNTDELFSKWYRNKKKYIEMFGDQLIYEMPEVKTFSLDEDARSKKLGQLIDAILDDPRVDDNLAFFLNRNRDDFFNKKLSSDYLYCDGVIPKGMKIIKAFHFFIKNKSVLEEYQNYASRIIQEDKVSGRLCFSVHPLDYLTMSETTLKWRSCHSLDGEYRAGNLAYMIDEATVICYLKTDEDVSLPNMPQNMTWNNKKWRMLLYFSETMDMVFASRQYPFASHEILNYLLNSGLLYHLFHLSAPSNWSEEWQDFSIDNIKTYKHLNTTYLPYRGYLYPVEDFFYGEDDRDFPKLAFNDVISSSCYKPLWIASHDFSGCGHKGHHPMFHVADEYVPCLDCGEHYLDQSDMMTCRECYDDYYCDHVYCELCGSRIYADDDSYELSSGGTMCRHCAEEYTVLCEHCGMLETKSSAVKLDEDGEVILCSHCHDYWWTELNEEEQERWLREVLPRTM